VFFAVQVHCIPQLKFRYFSTNPCPIAAPVLDSPLVRLEGPELVMQNFPEM
jgi:hypothetical protein